MFTPRCCLDGAERRPSIPEKPTLEGLGEQWDAVWERDGTYRFDRTRTRDEIFSIDTPPPTVSGSLHVGHVFSYTHTDLIARGTPVQPATETPRTFAVS